MNMEIFYPTNVAVICENCKKHGECVGAEDCYEVLMDRIAAYQDTGLTPEEIMGMLDYSNYPLTMEELREMDGEPVYIVDYEHPENSGWDICDPILTDEWCNYDNVATYEKTWIAYRRKPEEKAT